MPTKQPFLKRGQGIARFGMKKTRLKFKNKSRQRSRHPSKLTPTDKSNGREGNKGSFDEVTQDCYDGGVGGEGIVPMNLHPLRFMSGDKVTCGDGGGGESDAESDGGGVSHEGMIPRNMIRKLMTREMAKRQQFDTSSPTLDSQEVRFFKSHGPNMKMTLSCYKFQAMFLTNMSLKVLANNFQLECTQ